MLVGGVVLVLVGRGVWWGVIGEGGEDGGWEDCLKRGEHLDGIRSLRANRGGAPGKSDNEAGRRKQSHISISTRSPPRLARIRVARPPTPRRDRATVRSQPSSAARAACPRPPTHLSAYPAFDPPQIRLGPYHVRSPGGRKSRTESSLVPELRSI